MFVVVGTIVLVIIGAKAFEAGGVWVMGVAVSWSLCAFSFCLAAAFRINPMPLFLVGFCGFGFSGMMGALSEVKRHNW